MPRPVYTLCCESGAEDRLTGLASHFRVIETITTRRFPRPPSGQATLYVPVNEFQCVSVWELLETDQLESEFEYIVSIFLPPDGFEHVAAQGVIRFPTRRYRIMINFRGEFFRGPGPVRAVSRLRRIGAGEDSWITQEYSFTIVEYEYPEGVEPSAETLF